MIISFLTTLGKAISVLVEALLPGGTGSAFDGEAHKPLPKDEKGKRMDQKQTQSLGEFTRKIRCQSSKSLA